MGKYSTGKIKNRSFQFFHHTSISGMIRDIVNLTPQALKTSFATSLVIQPHLSSSTGSRNPHRENGKTYHVCSKMVIC